MPRYIDDDDIVTKIITEFTEKQDEFIINTIYVDEAE